MKDTIMAMLGVLVLSGGSNGNSYSYPEESGEDYHHSPEISVYLSRIENLEERLDELESSMLLRDTASAIPVERQYRDVPDLASTKNMKAYAASDYYKEVFSTPFGCKMWVDYNQVFFEGCNVHIINSSGLGGTEDRGDGLGNLIIGKNTCPVGNPNCDPVNPGYPSGADPDRSGSHNIVVGNGHTWTEEAVNSVIFGLENIIAGPNSAILGGNLNKNSGARSTIVNGFRNIINQDTSDSAIIGGDKNILSSAAFSTISGGKNNIVSSSSYSALVGGASNEIAGNNSVILGGTDNTVISEDSSILGGSGNITRGKNSVIVSGENNTTDGHHAVILGGRKNNAGGEHASVLNGFLNRASGKFAMVSTGYLNAAKGDYSFIATGGGGNCQGSGNWIWCLQNWGNIAEGTYSSIIGGSGNKTIGPYSSIISGSNNTTPGRSAVVVGGGPEAKIFSLMFPTYDGNSAIGNFSVVVGGLSNKSVGNSSAILGGGNNETHGRGSAVTGGGGIILDIGDEQPYNPGNVAYGDFSLVAGGEHNWAGTFYKDENDVLHLTGDNAVAVGGKDNGAYAPRSCAVGGRGNSITSAEMGSTFGGAWNQVSGQLSVIVGGQNNVSAGYATLVSGGMHNWAFDHVSAIFGGLFNVVGVPINGNYPYRLYNIDTDILENRAGMTTVGGYRNRAFDNFSTVLGGTRNIAGHVPQNEDYCVQCSSCFSLAPVTVHDNGPLVSIIPHDCSCQEECYTSNMTTSGATITGGNDNHLGSYLQNGLYYPWIAGYGFDYSYMGSGAQ